jgi:hypothetical protein
MLSFSPGVVLGGPEEACEVWWEGNSAGAHAPTRRASPKRNTLVICVCFINENLFYLLMQVGTEEGSIHKCSKAYSSQYLSSYQVRAPYCFKLFCTCHYLCTLTNWVLTCMCGRFDKPYPI